MILIGLALTFIAVAVLAWAGTALMSAKRYLDFLQGRPRSRRCVCSERRLRCFCHNTPIDGDRVSRGRREQ